MLGILPKRGSDKVNKGEFTDKLSTETGLSKKDVRMALNAVIDLIPEYRASNEDVLLNGFGKVEARVGRESKRLNPLTQKRIAVPKNVVPVFKPGKNPRKHCYEEPKGGKRRIWLQDQETRLVQEHAGARLDRSRQCIDQKNGKSPELAVRATWTFVPNDSVA